MRKTVLKKEFLREKIIDILKSESGGKILDLGCGQGHFSFNLQEQGFDITCCDVAEDNFQYHDCIPFKKGNIYEGLPFTDSSFDYVLFIETIEHLEKPYEAIAEISRVLKKGGTLILSTPNILHIGSRMRFLFEGAWDFFREPPIELQKYYIGTIENIHIIPWRYHELEYMLHRKGFDVIGINADIILKKFYPLLVVLYPLLWMQRLSKEKRGLRKGGVDYRRIHSVLFSQELMLGKHLIIKAKNTKCFGQAFGKYQRELDYEEKMN